MADSCHLSTDQTHGEADCEHLETGPGQREADCSHVSIGREAHCSHVSTGREAHCSQLRLLRTHRENHRSLVKTGPRKWETDGPRKSTVTGQGEVDRSHVSSHCPGQG